MSGHSKWKNIMHKKEKTDAQRAKVFTKIGKEIAIAVKEAGADPVSNTKLRDLISKAKSLNVPNDNIERTIKKASGSDAVTYEEIVYEGYGPSGVAVIVETATDSKNRTAGNVRHYFDKFGGNLGQSGCVSFMFASKGVLDVSAVDEYGDKVVDGDKLMEDALEAGAEDFSEDGDIYDIVAGKFFLCGLGDENFASLPKELQQKYEEKFRQPEAFLKMGSKIMAIPTEPAKAAGKGKAAPVTER